MLLAEVGRGRIVEDLPLAAVEGELAAFLADPFAAAAPAAAP